MSRDVAATEETESFIYLLLFINIKRIFFSSFSLGNGVGNVLG